MSRLLQKMRDHAAVNGKADLCKASGREMRTVEKWLAGQALPKTQLRYKIARQCGCTHEEALELAQELPEVKERAG